MARKFLRSPNLYKGEDSQFMANRRAASTHVCPLKRAQTLTRVTSLP